MAWFLIALPLLAAVRPSPSARRPCGRACCRRPRPCTWPPPRSPCAATARLSARRAWLGLDALGGWTLLVISVLFCFCAWYAPAYLALRPERDNRVFVASFLCFLGLASLLAQARHPGLVWVAMETTTLATAPLIYFNHNKRSIEATWKYLIIGSVGIALALLGTLFLAYSAQHGRPAASRSSSAA